MPEPVVEVKPVEPVVEVKPAEVPLDDFIPLQVDGKTINVKTSEFVQLAQYGYRRLQEGDTSKEVELKDTPKEVTVDDLQKRIDQLEGNLKHKDEIGALQNELSQARNTSERTKTNEKFHESVSIETLARLNFNPRLNPTETYKKVIAERLEMMNEETQAVKKGKALVNPTLRGTGESSLIDTAKKFKAEDVRSGASKRALEDLLKKLTAE